MPKKIKLVLKKVHKPARKTHNVRRTATSKSSKKA